MHRPMQKLTVWCLYLLLFVFPINAFGVRIALLYRRALVADEVWETLIQTDPEFAYQYGYGHVVIGIADDDAPFGFRLYGWMPVPEEQWPAHVQRMSMQQQEDWFVAGNEVKGRFVDEAKWAELGIRHKLNPTMVITLSATTDQIEKMKAFMASMDESHNFRLVAQQDGLSFPEGASNCLVAAKRVLAHVDISLPVIPDNGILGTFVHRVDHLAELWPLSGCYGSVSSYFPIHSGRVFP